MSALSDGKVHWGLKMERHSYWTWIQSSSTYFGSGTDKRKKTTAERDYLRTPRPTLITLAFLGKWTQTAEDCLETAKDARTDSLK